VTALSKQARATPLSHEMKSQRSSGRWRGETSASGTIRWSKYLDKELQAAGAESLRAIAARSSRHSRCSWWQVVCRAGCQSAGALGLERRAENPARGR
jgi:hypothetical protein